MLILDSLVREGLVREVMFEQRPKVREEASCAENLGKSIPDRGNSKYKGPVVGTICCIQRTSRKANVAAVNLGSSDFAWSPQDPGLVSDESLSFLLGVLDI